jgi:transcription initiation factor TFIID subunit 12
MNNPNSAQAAQSLPPLQALIKAEQIANIPNLNEETRTKYAQGITALWATIRTQPENSPERQNAHKKLAGVTTNLRDHMRKAAINASANAGRPANPGQPTQDGRAQGQQPIQPSQQPKPEQQQFSAKVAQSVAQLTLVVPPDIATQGQEKAQTWLREAKHRYAIYAQKYEYATNSLRAYMSMMAQRQREGRQTPAEEMQELQGKKAQWERDQAMAKEYVTKFKAQQDQFREQMAARDQRPDGAITQDLNMGAMEGVTDLQSSKHQSLSEHQGHKDVNSAIDAARQQAGSAGRNAMSPSNGQPSHPPASHASEPIIKKEPQPSQLPMEMNTSGPPLHHNSPQVGQSHPQTMPTSQGGPVALTHNAAMRAAQSYSSQPNYQQPNSQPPPHGHPQLPRGGDPQNNNVKMPIPKDLKIPPLQPVSMGPARPTLTGGPSNGAIGQLGQPAIQKHPGYVLEGDGERVLSKKKLQELVKQVTGVGEGDDTEGLTPEVEEVSFSLYSYNRIRSPRAVTQSISLSV